MPTTLEQPSNPTVSPSFGNRIGRTWTRFREKAGTFIVLGVLASLPVIPAAMIEATGGERMPPVALIAAVVVAGLVSMVVTPSLSFAAAYKIGLAKSLGHGIRRSPAFIWTTLAGSFALMLPSLLWLPGLIMGVRFSLMLPVIVVERRSGFEALARSRNLVLGRTGNVLLNLMGFGFLAGSVTAVVFGVSFLALIPLSAIGVPVLSTAVVGTLQAIGSALYASLAVIFWQVLYEDMIAEKGMAPARGSGLHKALAVIGFLCIAGAAAAGILLGKIPGAVPGEAPAPAATAPEDTPVAYPREDRPATEEPETEPPAETTEETLTAEDRDWLRYGDVNAIRIALGSYRNEYGVFPDGLEGLVPDQMSALPTDPLSGADYGYSLAEGNYTLNFTFEEGVLALAPGPHILTPRGFDLPNTEPAPDVSRTETVVETVPPEETDETPSTEEVFPTTPETRDTDADGLTDAEEQQAGTDPAAADTDSDGLTDLEEVRIYGTDPLEADTDSDGFTDGQEIARGYDPAGEGPLPDLDSDGLADAYEDHYGFDGGDPDMDDDGIADGDEVRVYATDPRVADTDGDGYTDLAEIYGGYDPAGPGRIEGELAGLIDARIGEFGLHEPTATNLSR